MKFKQLIIRNIASIENAVIEFDKDPLDGARLFLINGPTGSGKSVILDAMCLALFRTAPRLEGLGNRKSPDDSVRSGELPLSSPLSLVRRGTASAEASLLFEGNDGRCYRASWVVSPYVKGVNAGKINTEVHILEDCETGCTWDKKNDVRELIESQQLTGLDYDRFSRTVMLAQGGFSRFLAASETDKAAILEKIVGIGVFSKTGREIRAIKTRFQKELDTEREILKVNPPLAEELRLEKEETLARLKESLTELQTRSEVIASLKECFDSMDVAFGSVEREKRSLAGNCERRPVLKQSREAIIRQLREKDGERLRLIEQREVVTAEMKSLGLDGMRTELAQLSAETESLNKCRLQLERVSAMLTETERMKRTESEAVTEIQRLNGELPAKENELKSASADVEAMRESIEIARRGISDAAVALRHGLRVGDSCPVCGSEVISIIADSRFVEALRPLEWRMQELKAVEKQKLDAVSSTRAAIKLRETELAKVRRESSEAEKRITTIRRSVSELLGLLGVAINEIDGGVTETVDARIAANAEKQSGLNRKIERAAEINARLMEKLKSYTVFMDEYSRLEKESAALSSEISSLEELISTRRKSIGEQLTGISLLRRQATLLTPEGCGFLVTEDVARYNSDLQMQINSLNRTIGQVSAEIRSDDDTRKRNAERMKRIAGLEHKVELWTGIDRNFGGEKGERFNRIACAFILSQLLDRANYYLDMFDNRYQLEGRPDSLEIMIYDSLAGHVRAFNTLSGGECFMVSLALALGLSAFQDTASTPDTIFIDEGFGTLSADCLDSVTETLERLQNIEGRRVGIISHVETLRDRITTRITVIPSGTRSTIRVE